MSKVFKYRVAMVSVFGIVILDWGNYILPNLGVGRGHYIGTIRRLLQYLEAHGT